MENRVSVELHDIKKSLEKCLPEINHEEQIFDLLCALDRIQLTPKLIKETKLGNLMSSIRNKFKETDIKISDKASALMSSWKKLIEVSMKEKSHPETAEHNKHDKKEDYHHAKAVTANFVQSTPVTSSGAASSKLDQSTLNLAVNSLPASRKIVFNIFLNTMKPSCSAEAATSVALKIEEELYQQFPSEAMLKGYTNKAKSLSFNLKKNDVSTCICKYTPFNVHLSLLSLCFISAISTTFFIFKHTGPAQQYRLRCDHPTQPALPLGRGPRLPRAKGGARTPASRAS